MSSEAIDQRLRDLAQLWRLGMELADVQVIGKLSDFEVPESFEEDSPGSPATDPESSRS